MPEVALVIAAGGILVFMAHFFAWLFSFTAIPDGLLLMIVGMVLGIWLEPTFFGEFGSVILTIALVIMLFESGTELRFSFLREAWSGTFKLTMANFILSLAGVGLVIWWFTDLPLIISLMIGAIVGGTTSAVVIPLLDKLKVGSSSKALLILESAFSDVLSIVVTIALLQAHQTGFLSLSTVFWQIVVSFIYASLFGVISGFIWSLFLDEIRHIRNSIFVTPAFVFVLFGLVEFLGFSGPIAALAFGIILGNVGSVKNQIEQSNPLLRWLIRPVSLSRREKAFFNEIVFLLQTFFFVFVGLSITVSNLGVVLLSISLAVLLLFLRLIAVRASLPRTTPVNEASLMSVLVPKGLAAAVLATLVVEQGIGNGELVQDIVYGVILWSIVFTSLAVFLLQKTGLQMVYHRLLRGYSTDPIKVIDHNV